MNSYRLVFVQRQPGTKKLTYKLLCNGQIVVSSCGYQEGYAEAARRMTAGDTFQEIEGSRESKIMTYAEMLEGHLIMNNDQS
jgi:hypothetical protein